MQMNGLISRQRINYRKAIESLSDEADPEQSALHRYLLQPESCVGHFVHLLAHHPALASKEGLDAVAESSSGDEDDEHSESTSSSSAVVSLKAVLRAKPNSSLHEWQRSVGRQGLLKGMTDQIDFFLRGLFAGQSQLENAEMILAILSTIGEVCGFIAPVSGMYW